MTSRDELADRGIDEQRQLLVDLLIRPRCDLLRLISHRAYQLQSMEPIPESVQTTLLPDHITPIEIDVPLNHMPRLNITSIIEPDEAVDNNPSVENLERCARESTLQIRENIQSGAFKEDKNQTPSIDVPPKWDVASLIDLEYLNAVDESADVENLKRRDRAFFIELRKTCTLDSTALDKREFVLRRWVEKRRDSPDFPMPGPGEATNDVLAIIRF